MCNKPAPNTRLIKQKRSKLVISRYMMELDDESELDYLQHRNYI